MPTLEDVRSYLADEHGLAVISTVQADRRVLSSIANCGVHTDPVTGDDCVALVSAGNAARLRHIRAGSPVTVAVRRGWRWIGVTGPARLIGPDDTDHDMNPDDVRLLLRSVFQAAGGAHHDFDEYDRVMADEHRTAVFVAPDRIIGNG